jgi:hypothetical protein
MISEYSRELGKWPIANRPQAASLPHIGGTLH